MGKFKLKKKIRSGGIKGVGSHLPKRVLTNEDLVDSGLRTTSEWIRTKTGISTRRIASPSEGSVDLGVSAAKKAMRRAGVKTGDLDLVIASGTPDYFAPTNSCLIVDRLDAENAASFDLRNFCSSFNHSLAVAEKFIADSTYDNILIVCTEVTSRFVDYGDRTTSIFFGDGAGAAIVGPVSEGYGIISSYLKTAKGDKMALSYLGGGVVHPATADTVRKRLHYIRMDGKAIWDFAIKAFPEAVRNALIKANLSVDDVDLIIPHQANINIIKEGMQELGLPMSKSFTNLHKYGNTTSASILIALDEALRRGRLNRGDIIVLVGFGAALTYGANVIRWDDKPPK